jgi:hypothetical protein
MAAAEINREAVRCSAKVPGERIRQDDFVPRDEPRAGGIEKTAKNPILAASAANPRNHWWFSRVFHTVKSAKIRK